MPSSEPRLDPHIIPTSIRPRIMKKSLSAFVYEQWSTVPPVVTADLSEETVIIVGASAGIGLEATKHFARMKPGRLIVACRNEAKGKSAVAGVPWLLRTGFSADSLVEVGNETGYNRAELWLVDLADFASVIAFANKFERGGGRLDVLVMNAGILMTEYEGTVDGWESTIQVNHLSTALLSLLLLPHLWKSASPSKPSRLVIVSSDVHYWVKFKPEIQSSQTPLKMLGSKEYSTPTNMEQRYNESKLLNVFFVRALTEHLSQHSVTTIAVNPGFCYSQLRRTIYSQRLKNIWMAGMEKVFAWTSEQGSRQLVYAAIGGREDESKMRAGYVNRGTTVEVADFVLSEDGGRMQAKIWASPGFRTSQMGDGSWCALKLTLSRTGRDYSDFEWSLKPSRSDKKGVLGPLNGIAVDASSAHQPSSLTYIAEFMAGVSSSIVIVYRKMQHTGDHICGSCMTFKFKLKGTPEG
ncbi:NAD(P)-binding protein [Leucogyrophana mollusca]|uniref:NAD(P)-binding protein n=1 Tax=Leucogyrophana mollusca TaxID=85980 RepID=A0ACB8B9Z8_9AGAM|nr:NAD(P)-binding protein [Leucogyrophana mollusca]